VQNFTGVICSYYVDLTDEFDGGGKLINIMQFQRIIEVLLISRG